MRIFRPENVILRLFSTIAAVLVTSTGYAAPKAPSDQDKAEHRASVQEANQLLNGFFEEEKAGLRHYLPRRGTPEGPAEHYDIHIPSRTTRTQIPEASLEDMTRDRATHQLANEYYSHQGDDRYVGTFIESGSPGQWNTQRWAGITISSLRQKAFDAARANGIRNIRFGVNLQNLDLRKPESASLVTDICRDAWSRGISVTLAMLFFPNLTRWETHNPDGTIDAYRSYLLHPNFAKDAGAISEFVLRQVKKAGDQFNAQNAAEIAAGRLPVARIAVNPVNEAETLAGFTGQFWHGALAKWNDPNAMRSYVPATVNIARAALAVRQAVYSVYGKERILFYENPAMTTSNYPSHQGDLQMAVNKFILGDEDLMDANYAQLRIEPLESIRARFEAGKSKGHINVVEASILKYAMVPANVSAGERERAKEEIVARLKGLRDAHVGYTRRTSLTAKTDTMLMLDYYAQSEFVLPRPVPVMVQELSANHGALLRYVLGVESDAAFMTVLRDRALGLEALVGHKIWRDYQRVTDIPFVEFLTLEDGLMFDKMIGLKNEWNLRPEQEFAERRARTGLKFESFGDGDEKRSDAFLNALLANGEARLRIALNAKNDKDLLKQFRMAAKDVRFGGGVVQFASGESIRSILNADGRAIMNRLFGLQRSRITGYLPPHYGRQTRAEIRRGFYETFIHYVSELGVRVGGIGETGSPYFPWGDMVAMQMVLELVEAADVLNFYIVRADIGPMIGTVGWQDGPLVGTLKENGRRGADGILNLIRNGPRDFSYQLSAWQNARPFFEVFKQKLNSGLERQHERARLARPGGRCEDLFRSH